MQSPSTRHDYLDQLKAISICLVIFWHLRPLRLSYLGTSQTSWLDRIPSSLIYIFNHQIALLAVPSFILISLFLLFEKSTQNKSYPLKRISRIAFLYIFWTTIQTTIYYLFIYRNASVSENAQKVPNISIETVLLRGGPKLPLIGESVFYFLSILLCLTILAVIYHRMLCSRLFKIIDFEKVSGLLVITALVLFEAEIWYEKPSPYWALKSFLVYIPIAYLLKQHIDIFATRYSTLLGMIYCLFSIHDIFLESNGVPLGLYSRISIVAGSVWLFCVLYQMSKVKQGFYIFPQQLATFTAKYSLGIFSLHQYAQLIILLIFSSVIQTKTKGIWIPISGLGISLNIFSVVVYIFTVVLTFAAVFAIARTPLKKIVS